MMGPLLALLLLAAASGPEQVIPITPKKFEFHCSVFCGSGHEEMRGQIVVRP